MGNKTINIVEDGSCGDSPRDWDNCGTMIAFHKRYDLGDKHSIKHEDYDSWDEMETALEKEYDALILPLYLYDHSGTSINTTGFSCNWDSGQVGFICCSKETAKAKMDWKRVTKKRKEQLKIILNSEVRIYDQYINGGTCGFEILDSDGNIEESCYGYYSEEEAEADAYYSIPEKLRQRTKKGITYSNIGKTK